VTRPEDEVAAPQEMGTAHDVVNPPTLAAPSGFSHVVAADQGRTVWLAGQTSLDAGGTIVGAGDIVAQYDRSLRNVLTALDGAGGRPDHLVSTTTYVVDIDGYRAHSRELGRTWRALVGSHYPAMAVVGVSRLWDREALVEIQAVAVVPA
jgi:enamine deaminase RidA (YjgF/YER057c/UK114 family)